MTTPDVSIIVITYNDAARLPRALASAQRQTLHNLEIIVVDDASTDGTGDFLATVDDPRVRSIRLERNSGGCSAPRNAGLDIARGNWVMFCDSDDELEIHAAKNLLIAAEQADADMACGVAERVDVTSGKTKRWRSEYHQPAVVADLTERPGLIFDTICVNKIYRRGWLSDLRFVNGLLYEDQLFTLQCYLRANRIAIIDQTVYYWYVEKLSESITQRRGEQRNVENRIAINQLMDAELSDRPDIRRLKDHKFLAHEVYLYLRTIERLDDDSARVLLGPLVAYASTLDLGAVAQLRPALRVAIYHLFLDDLPGVRHALTNITWSAVLDMPIVARDGRDFWGCEHLDTGPNVGELPADWWLDISALRASQAPIPQQRPCHRVESLTAAEIAGSTVDAYGNADQVREAALVWIGPGDRVLHRVPLDWNLRDGYVHWRTHYSVPNLRGHSAYLAVELAFGMAVNRTAVRWDGPLPASLIRGEFGTVRWRDTRSKLTVPERMWRRISGRLPRTSTLVANRGDRGQDASLRFLLAERAVGDDRHVPESVDPPLAVIAAHMARIDTAHLRATLDIAGRVVAYLPMTEPADDWLEHAEHAQAQTLVHRLDGQATHVPAAMRAWVSDARKLDLAEVLLLADLCVTDSPAMAVFISDLGIPLADRLDADITGKLPLSEAFVAEGNAAVDRIVAELGR